MGVTQKKTLIITKHMKKIQMSNKKKSIKNTMEKVTEQEGKLHKAKLQHTIAEMTKDKPGSNIILLVNGKDGLTKIEDLKQLTSTAQKVLEKSKSFDEHTDTKYMHEENKPDTLEAVARHDTNNRAETDSSLVEMNK